jgi:hypothetical protein
MLLGIIVDIGLVIKFFGSHYIGLRDCRNILCVLKESTNILLGIIVDIN